MTVLTAILNNCNEISEQAARKKTGFFGTTPNLTQFVFKELGKRFHEDMSLKEIEDVIAILETLPDFKDDKYESARPLSKAFLPKTTPPMPFLSNTSALQKDQGAVLDFWNAILKQGKQSAEFGVMPDYKTLANHLKKNFDCHDFCASNAQGAHKNIREIHAFLAPQQVANYKRDLSSNSLVSTQAFGEYLNSFAENPKGSEARTYIDFHRDIQLAGFVTQGKTDAEITQALYGFVVGNKDQASENDKKILAFLQRNGGQQIDRCFQMEMMNVLNAKERFATKNIGDSSGSQVWHKDPDSGEFYVLITKNVYSIPDGVMNVSYKVNNKTIQSEDMETASKYLATTAIKQPLLKAEIKIRLDLKNEQVTPVIESMKVMAYDETLKLVASEHFVPASQPIAEAKEEKLASEARTTIHFGQQ